MIFFLFLLTFTHLSHNMIFTCPFVYFNCRHPKMICHSVHRTQFARKSICTKRHGSNDSVDVPSNHTPNIITVCTMQKKCFAPTMPEVQTIGMCSNKNWNSAHHRVRRTVSITIWKTSTLRVCCKNWASFTTRTTSWASIMIFMTPITVPYVEPQENVSMAAVMPLNSITPDSVTVDIMMCHVSADVPAQSMKTTSTPLPTKQDCTNCASRFTNCHCAGKLVTRQSYPFIYLKTTPAKAVVFTHTHSLDARRWLTFFFHFAFRL